MSRRIQEDNKEFRDLIGGKLDQEIRKYVKSGKLVVQRPGKGGKFVINVPMIDLPTIRFGRNKTGWGRGEGEIGDVIDKDPQGSNKAGTDHADTMPVGVDIQTLLDLLQEELELPNIQPKDAEEIFKEHLVYNGIKKVGPESLRHNKRTMRNAMLRMMQMSEYDYDDPVIVPIQDDKRYRSWNITKTPDNNALIFFARDWSGSMDRVKCDIVMNTSWWLEQWIKRYYETVKTIYIGHDTEAQEVDQEKFYKERYGGGTQCSSAFELILEKIKYQFPPHSWNIYVFYFTDGENYEDDNDNCLAMIEELQRNANMIGIGQILYADYFGMPSFLEHVQSGNIDPEIVRAYDYKSKGSPYASDGEVDMSQVMSMLKRFLGKGKASK